MVRAVTDTSEGEGGRRKGSILFIVDIKKDDQLTKYFVETGF